MENFKRVAQFEKVSFAQFKKDFEFENIDIKEVYDNIKLPKRATINSAGYDFFAPLEIDLKPKQNIKIPTGIRCKIDGNWVLKIYPRSSLGFKFRLQLNNTVGIIDADYYNSANEGHIFCKITNDSNEDKVVNIPQGQGFCQGIFVEYGITFDDETVEIRNGGIGSTNKN